MNENTAFLIWFFIVQCNFEHGNFANYCAIHGSISFEEYADRFEKEACQDAKDIYERFSPESQRSVVENYRSHLMNKIAEAQENLVDVDAWLKCQEPTQVA